MGSHISHTSEEETYVLPPPCHRMDDDHPGAPAPLEQTPSHRLGPVEPGHGTGSLLCIDGRQCVFGAVAEAQRAARAPAVAGVLLRGHGHTWGHPLRHCCRALLCAALGLGYRPM